MNHFKIGDIIWYETGHYTASRAKIVDISGKGGAKTYVVHFIDHSPDQTNGSEVNRQWYKDGGIPVSYRKCKPLGNNP